MTRPRLLALVALWGVILWGCAHASPVNNDIPPNVSNINQYVNSTNHGNCVSHAIEKRDRLIQAGEPSSQLVIWQVSDELGESHAILMDGDKALDSRRRWASFVVDRPYLERHGYRFEEPIDDFHLWIYRSKP